jgi:formylglycine-generating enzyme required for sulfatase activity
MRIAATLLVLTVALGEAQAQSPIPNDPFQSVPPPPAEARPPASRPAQPARPAAAPGYPVAVGQSFRDCPECPELVVIPAGRFLMGSPDSEAGRHSDEGPQREVVVRAPLAVGKFEVTFAEWDACVAAGGCSDRPRDLGGGRGNRPVIDVNWNDAQEYVRWLSRRTGRTYRLLTEAEWEYAARAGTTTPYSFGQTISPSQANYYETGLRWTQPVGSYPANAWGLHDMHGNVWEWVEDCWVGSYAGAPVDASQAVTTEGCTSRVLRGGSWKDGPQFLRSAGRLRYITAYRMNNEIGFRLARTPGG